MAAHDSAADRLINDISVSEVTTASPLEKINEVIDTTATKTGLKRWHVIAAVVGKSKLKSSEKIPKQAYRGSLGCVSCIKKLHAFA